MTVVVSWTRKTKTSRELWVMSDSRLSGGKCWDYGPVISRCQTAYKSMR